MVASTVSSKMVESMARAEGFKFEECLTGDCTTHNLFQVLIFFAGFKWIGNTASQLEADHGLDVRFGYEEAIGFMFGKVIRDKDGVAALVHNLSIEGKSRLMCLHWIVNICRAGRGLGVTWNECGRIPRRAIFSVSDYTQY